MSEDSKTRKRKLVEWIHMRPFDEDDEDELRSKLHDANPLMYWMNCLYLIALPVTFCLSFYKDEGQAHFVHAFYYCLGLGLMIIGTEWFKGLKSRSKNDAILWSAYFISFICLKALFLQL